MAKKKQKEFAMNDDYNQADPLAEILATLESVEIHPEWEGLPPFPREGEPPLEVPEKDFAAHKERFTALIDAELARVKAEQDKEEGARFAEKIQGMIQNANYPIDPEAMQLLITMLEEKEAAKEEGGAKPAKAKAPKQGATARQKITSKTARQMITGLPGQVTEVVRELSGAKAGAQVYQIPLHQLESYPNQPFKPYSADKLRELADDIRQVGVLNPILARKKGSKLQILAGHNRWAAAALAGLREVPVLLLEADDDMAALVVTSTNLRQREKLLPSEKAFAYKLQMEALKRQGQRTGREYNAAGFITRQTGESRMQVHRFIRLTQLEPGLLELLDRGKIAMTPAVAVSHLTPANQKTVLRLLNTLGVSLTLDKANTLKTMALSREGEDLPEVEIETALALVRQSKSPPGIPYAKVRAFLPPDLPDSEIEATVIAALQAWQKQREAEAAPVG